MWQQQRCLTSWQSASVSKKPTFMESKFQVMCHFSLKNFGDIFSSRPAHHLIMDFKFVNYFLRGNAGHEGRIGMAAVTVKEGARFNGGKIYNHVLSYLPSYARPRFIRIQVTDLINTTHPKGWHFDFFFFWQFVFFSLLECYGGDRDFQANEGKVGGGGFWPNTYPGSSLHPWRSWEELHSYGASYLRSHRIRKPQTLTVNIK